MSSQWSLSHLWWAAGQVGGFADPGGQDSLTCPGPLTLQHAEDNGLRERQWKHTDLAWKLASITSVTFYYTKQVTGQCAPK